MKDSGEVKITASVSMELAEHEARLEKFLADKARGEEIRFSVWEQGRLLPQPLVLSETELLRLLHQAIQAGVLSHDFIGKLREGIEI